MNTGHMFVYMKTFRLNINQGNAIKTRHHFTPNILVKKKSKHKVMMKI